MPVLSNLCIFADADNSLLATSKRFNNMSETEGFDYPYSQYMSSVFLLRTCYNLLIQAGFKNVSKNEDEQSLTVWGLKLFFVNIAGRKDCINIAGPGINFLYKRNRQIVSGANECPSSSLGTPVVRYNHFLQFSLINAGNVYAHEGSMFASTPNVDYSGFECCNPFLQQTDDDGKVEYMMNVTLRCSNDGISFTTQWYNEREDRKGYQVPLFNIFKGKDVLNNKDILILGKKLERVPFVFSTPYADTNTAFTSANDAQYKSNNDSYATIYTPSTQSSTRKYIINRRQTNAGYFNMASPYCKIALNHYEYNNNNWFTQTSNVSNCITATHDSALVCSGNNLIYYADDPWTQLDDTLYLEWNYNIHPDMIIKGQAIANSGKYIVYGINQIVIDIPVQSNYYYDIEDEKYWCMFNHLINKYTQYHADTAIDKWKTLLETNYFNKIANHKGCTSLVLGYDTGNSGNGNIYDYTLNPTLDFLNMYANSFGKGKKNIYEDSTVLNADKKAFAVALNPAILMRIDDTIEE